MKYQNRNKSKYKRPSEFQTAFWMVWLYKHISLYRAKIGNHRTDVKSILAFAARFVGADAGSQLVENTVDEFMAVGAAESFGNFDGFVDDDRVGGFRHGAQLMAGNQQNGAFDRAEVFFVAVE